MRNLEIKLYPSYNNKRWIQQLMKSMRLLFILLMLGVLSAQAEVFAQGVTVTGTVNDNTGMSMPGVNVTVKGTTIGVVTDVNGNYSINAPNRDAVLVFSFVGYSSQEMTVGDQRIISISLDESTLQIDEVVVVGYGTQRKSDLTGSVVSVKGSDLKQLPTMRTDAALQGRAAGVSVQNTDGAPGGNVTIRVRGSNSISGGNNALVVIDGVQGQIGRAHV